MISGNEAGNGSSPRSQLASVEQSGVIEKEKFVGCPEDRSPGYSYNPKTALFILPRMIRNGKNLRREHEGKLV
jgi:hypothetical protein